MSSLGIESSQRQGLRCCALYLHWAHLTVCVKMKINNWHALSSYEPVSCPGPHKKQKRVWFPYIQKSGRGSAWFPYIQESGRGFGSHIFKKRGGFCVSKRISQSQYPHGHYYIVVAGLRKVGSLQTLQEMINFLKEIPPKKQDPAGN